LAMPSAKKQPTLETERLVLRPFVLADAPRVKLLAGDRAIAATTKNIPHPYEDGMAGKWIGLHQERFENGQEAVFGITLREVRTYRRDWPCPQARPGTSGDGLLGRQAVLGPRLLHGTARALLHYAFTDLGLHRVHASHLVIIPHRTRDAKDRDATRGLPPPTRKEMGGVHRL